MRYYFHYNLIHKNVNYLYLHKINRAGFFNRIFSQIKLPVLILHGTNDKATKPCGSQHFYESAGSTDKTLKLYEGYFHDLLNDLGKETVMTDMLQWSMTEFRKYRVFHHFVDHKFNRMMCRTSIRK